MKFKIIDEAKFNGEEHIQRHYADHVLKDGEEFSALDDDARQKVDMGYDGRYLVNHGSKVYKTRFHLAAITPEEYSAFTLDNVYILLSITFDEYFTASSYLRIYNATRARNA